MNKIATIAGLAVASTAMTASAEILLTVDLTVVDKITITATGGLSAVSQTGSNFTGFYLAGIFNTDELGFVETLISGDLSSANNASDGSPSLYKLLYAGDLGLNVWSFSTDSTVTFSAGTTAFAGSAVWSIDSVSYASLASGPTSGNIYFAANNASNIPGAQLLGTWNVVPAPSAMALLGLGGIVAGRRRR